MVDILVVCRRVHASLRAVSKKKRGDKMNIPIWVLCLIGFSVLVLMYFIFALIVATKDWKGPMQ